MELFIHFTCISSIYPCHSMFQYFIPLYNIPLYGYTTFCLSTNQLIDNWVLSIFGLLWTVLLCTFMYRTFFEHLFSNSFGYIPRNNYLLEFLGHTVILWITFWGVAKLFSTTTALFYVPTSNVLEFQFLHILTNIFCFFKNVFWFF